MTKPLKLSKFGNSVGAIFPKEMLAKLRADVGDSIFVSETPDGYHISSHDPEFERRMAAAERIMREDRDILRVLAK